MSNIKKEIKVETTVEKATSRKKEKLVVNWPSGYFCCQIAEYVSAKYQETPLSQKATTLNLRSKIFDDLIMNQIMI